MSRTHEPSRARTGERNARRAKLITDHGLPLDPNSRGKTMTPEAYARWRWQRDERERVTGNRDASRRR